MAKSRRLKIAEETILRLYVVAGGRCSFAGCNEYVLNEPLTDRKARLGNIAHIVAQSPRGPRGEDPLPPAMRSEIDNLMLLCTSCHAFVDKKEFERDYPAALLRQFKKAHEDHIRRMTGTALKERTTALRMIGQIRGHLVAVGDAEIREAVFAREGRHVSRIVDIDIGAIADSAESDYTAVARDKILRELNVRVLPEIEAGEIERLSIFALSRIPLLCELGHALGDKVPVELYQRHRVASDGWCWPAAGTDVTFDFVQHRNELGTDASRLAVFVAVSGGEALKVVGTTTARDIYEIRPVGADPSRTLLDAPATLHHFRACYQRLLSFIEMAHPAAAAIDLFLAVPAPIAVICGRDIARDVVPDVHLYDLVGDGYVVASVLKTRTSGSAGLAAPPRASIGAARRLTPSARSHTPRGEGGPGVSERGG